MRKLSLSLLFLWKFSSEPVDAPLERIIVIRHLLYMLNLTVSLRASAEYCNLPLQWPSSVNRCSLQLQDQGKGAQPDYTSVQSSGIIQQDL